MKKFLTIVFLAALSTSAFAGNNTGSEDKVVCESVRGIVVDGVTNEPIVGAVVTLNGSEEKAYTNFDGEFEFDNIPTGKYNIEASMVSYTDLKLRAVAVNAQCSTITLKLH